MTEIAIDQSNLPRVQEVCRGFAVLEDGALAHNLQEQEIEQHYASNIEKNKLVRQDVCVAKKLQDEEEMEAKHYSRELQQQIEELDCQYAKTVQEEIQKRLEECIRLEQEDKEVARRLQEEEELRNQRRLELEAELYGTGEETHRQRERTSLRAERHHPSDCSEGENSHCHGDDRPGSLSRRRLSGDGSRRRRSAQGGSVNQQAGLSISGAPPDSSPRISPYPRSSAHSQTPEQGPGPGSRSYRSRRDGLRESVRPDQHQSSRGGGNRREESLLQPSGRRYCSSENNGVCEDVVREQGWRRSDQQRNGNAQSRIAEIQPGKRSWRGYELNPLDRGVAELNIKDSYESDQEQLQRDEALARWLQAEEEARMVQLKSRSQKNQEEDFLTAQVAQDEEIAKYIQRQELKAHKQSKELEQKVVRREYSGESNDSSERQSEAGTARQERLNSEGFPSPSGEQTPERGASPTEQLQRARYLFPRNIAEELDPTFKTKNTEHSSGRLPAAPPASPPSRAVPPDGFYDYLDDSSQPTFVPPTRRQEEKLVRQKSKDKKEGCKQQ
ncbi:coiled-coil domain-containing protein 187 isoform X1 [Heptranchias perlo]|uniref:coiled-coil domain-containing protein 187 isoform X1 n=1 Tax=Heptranchias perlo TaxID=212740 RepID=UPI00355A42D7